MSIEEYWSRFFDISLGQLRSSGIAVVPHEGLAGYKGAWIFRHRHCWIISLPGALQEEIADKVRGRLEEKTDLFNRESLNVLFGARITKIIGPTFQGYYDQKQIKGKISDQVCILDREADKKKIEDLARSGDPMGWSHSGTEQHQDHLFGFEEDGKLLSIANYKKIGPDVGFIGVFTHPAYRGRGLGQQVVKRAVADLVSSGKLVLYQTLLSNTASVALARKIGVKEFATSLAVRFYQD